MRTYGPGALSAVGENYAVVCGCHEATAAAVDMLRRGGNVVDAALAASATLCVALPQAVSVGGDLFALVKLGDAPVVAVNATGAAPLEGTVAAYRARGYRSVPVSGPLSIQTPGFVAGWQALADRWASRPLGELLSSAITYASEGVRVTPRLAACIAATAPSYGSYPGFRQTFSIGSRLLEAGDLMVQRPLARTLQAIADAGAAGFYDGWVARDMVRTVHAAGGFINDRDLSAVRADVGPPLSTRFRDFAVLTQPPISQGAVLLRALRMLAARVPDPSRVSLPQYWSEAAAGIQAAFRERLTLLGDAPDMVRTAAAMVAGEIPAGVTAPSTVAPYAHAGTETTTLAVMDRAGNAVSIIQSIFADLGAGVVAPESGVLLNNRLSAFFLDADHPNGLRPGRRTMHTLHSFIAADDDGVRWAGGSPGGDIQPQVNLQVLGRMIDYGKTPEQAVSAARWAVMPGTIPVELATDPDPVVRIDPELDGETREVFRDMGFQIKEVSDHTIGSAKLVGRSSCGQGVGAWCDQRRDATIFAG
jgi:gamma-glutamyltranspeptidase/glutathione hydrolase